MCRKYKRLQWSIDQFLHLQVCAWGPVTAVHLVTDPVREGKLRQAAPGPLRSRRTFSLMLSLSLVHQCILSKNYLSLGPEGMVTLHKVLLMELLCLGSKFMIIIVTSLAWESVSQDSTHDYTARVYLARRCCPEPFSLAKVVPKLSQDVCLGKGSGGTLTTLRSSSYLFSAAIWEVYKVP